MTANVYLYALEVIPTDVRLRDPTVSGGAVPETFFLRLIAGMGN